jgi:surface antigen
MSMARGVDPPARRSVLARAGARGQRLQLLLSARQHAREKGRGQGRLDRNDPVGRAQAGDLAIARTAASEVLTKGGTHTSLPWENPKTGARGTVTPLASTYQQDGITCRDFLASYVKNGSESWLQGEACRAERGKWQVRNLRPRSST